MTEAATYCSECGRRVAARTDGTARQHNRGARNRGLAYPCPGSRRPVTGRANLDAARALRPAREE